jgi:hypothetical protein
MKTHLSTASIILGLRNFPLSLGFYNGGITRNPCICNRWPSSLLVAEETEGETLG